MDIAPEIAHVIIPGVGKRPLAISTKQTYKPALLLRDLADFGYEKVTRLAKPGEFRYLGDVLDIFPFRSPYAFRIEFCGNEVECISRLDLAFTPLQETIEKRLKRSFLERLEIGDYVVHLDHGIGRFREHRTIEGSHYLLLEYAKGDKLFVPLSALKKLTPYIGFGRPILHRLHTLAWASTKRKVNEAAFKLAKELLELYAKREVAKRSPLQVSKEMFDEFVKSAGFELTKDQKNAIKDIQKDLLFEKPMDRLICGDVGFGKTEVALHAAFITIMAAKQAVLLTPTTLLADQHFHYIRKRFKPFDISVSLVSRIKTNQSLPYDAPLIVGTHKLLFHLQEISNLGLVIIDEEQKFGVRQKEQFKALRASIDILSLSATPIPRTFQLALAGLRDISNITTPLPGKEPTLTYIFPFDKKKVREAIEEELARDGQIYYLVPRIKDIPKARDILEKFFPGTEIGIAHGKLPEHRLLATMHQFRKKQFPILIATTIIENGLDLEDVNTLIVQDAQKLGLAQAHQIRGRVGRRFRQAKAYFFYNYRKITSEGKKRLRLLRQFQGLGENYAIALKDLEMRGAGSILGKEQSGNIRAVGLQLYSEMLQEAVKTLSQKAKLSYHG